MVFAHLLIATQLGLGNPTVLAPGGAGEACSGVLVLDCYFTPPSISKATVCVLVGSDLIATTYHGLARAQRAFVNLGLDGNIAVESVVYSDAIGDIVVAKLAKPVANVSAMHNTNKNLPANAQIRVITKTANGSCIVTPSTLIEFEDFGVSSSLILDLRGVPGFSGSAVVDEQGRLVGIVTGHENDAQSKTRAFPTIAIEGLLLGKQSSQAISFSQWYRREGGENAEQYWRRYQDGLSAEHYGNYKDAIDAYKEALALKPDGWSALSGLNGAMKLAGESFEKREELLVKLANQAPQSRFAQWIVLCDAVRLGKADVTTLRRVDEMLQRPETTYWLAVETYKLGKTSDALTLLETSLVKYPFHNRTAEGIASLALALNNRALEERSLHHLCSMNPGSANALGRLAKFQLREKKLVDFQETRQQIMSVDPFAKNRLDVELDINGD